MLGVWNLDNMNVWYINQKSTGQ